MTQLPYVIAEGDTTNADKIQINFEQVCSAIDGVSVSSLNPKGAYGAGTSYVKGDLVSYGGSSYAAIGNTTGNLPTNASYWVQVASVGNTGATGAKGDKGDTGLTGASITSGAFVSNDLVFTKDDTNTVTIINAKTDLKGDQGIQGIQGIPGVAVIDADSLIETTFIEDVTNTNTYTGTFIDPLIAYTKGLKINLKVTNANTGASSLNIDSLGAKSIKKNVSEDVIADDIKAGQIIPLIYDGTNFQIVGGGSGGSGDFLVTQVFS
jgi:hypothetical protein